MKRGEIHYDQLGYLFLAIVGFLVISTLIGVSKLKAEEKTSDELCRLSIAAREKTGIEVDKYGVEVVDVELAPLLCKTEEAEDIGNDLTKEEVKKYVAENIARCWYKYYEGAVKGVKGSTFTTKCQICQPFNVKKWKDYNGPITSEDLIVFMHSNIYKVEEDTDNCKLFGGKCMTSAECNEKINENEYFKKDDDTKCSKDEEKICCYSAYDCLNKGGVCSSEKPNEKYLEYNWKCPNGKCWIKDENYYSYLEYIQRYNGAGVVSILIPDIHPGEGYAISFASPTDECGEFCETASIPGSAMTVIGLGGTALGIYTFNPALIGGSLKLAGVGLISYGVGVGTAQLETEVYNIFKQRKINTIYLSTYNDAVHKNICEVS